MELALQILLGDLEIAHGHGDVIVTQQLHESRKTDPETEHLCGEGVAAMPRPGLCRLWACEPRFMGI